MRLKIVNDPSGAKRAYFKAISCFVCHKDLSEVAEEGKDFVTVRIDGQQEEVCTHHHGVKELSNE